MRQTGLWLFGYTSASPSGLPVCASWRPACCIRYYFPICFSLAVAGNCGCTFHLAPLHGFGFGTHTGRSPHARTGLCIQKSPGSVSVSAVVSVGVAFPEGSAPFVVSLLLSAWTVCGSACRESASCVGRHTPSFRCFRAIQGRSPFDERSLSARVSPSAEARALNQVA